MKLITALILFFTFSGIAQAYVDLNLGYTFSMRKIDGVNADGSTDDAGAATTTTNGYNAVWAWYMWEYTALEFNYSKTKQRLLDDRPASTADDSIKIVELDSILETEVTGIGLRQAFASRKSAIIPSISLGYAKYTTSGVSRYTLDQSGTKTEFKIEKDKEVSSSSYATFSLRFRLTKLMGFTLAAKTVMPDFDTSKASDNVTYSAGFSWIF